MMNEPAKHSKHYYDYDRNGKLFEVKIEGDAPWIECMDGLKIDDYIDDAKINHDSFGQKPWDESMLAPNGDSIEAFPHVTRVEVIGNNGREFVQWDCSNVKISIQDDKRTLKVFLS